MSTLSCITCHEPDGATACKVGRVSPSAPPAGLLRLAEDSEPYPSTPADILVIGYGNDLRGDDGVGPRLASDLESERLPGVRALARHQLTPELSELLAGMRRVIFVDASVTAHEPEAQPLRSEGSLAGLDHQSDPQSLLAMATFLFGRAPEAWLVRIPAAQFGFGAALSPTALRGLAEGAALVRRLCQMAH